MEESERRRRRHRKRSPRGSPREAGRSQSRKRRRSSGKRSRSPLPREKRSRSPRHAGVRMKQEPEDHSRRGHEERQNQDRSELEHRQRKSNRERYRDHSARRKLTKEQAESHGREQDAHHLLDQQAEREFYNERRRQHRQLTEGSGDEENSEGRGPSNKNMDKEASKKEKPSFELSGALLEDSNTFRGVVIKYTEPPEARIPKKRWRLYPFKNDEVLPVMYIHRQSAYLLGRHRRIADIPIDHPSCSKQHAVFQYRPWATPSGPTFSYSPFEDLQSLRKNSKLLCCWTMWCSPGSGCPFSSTLIVLHHATQQWSSLLCFSNSSSQPFAEFCSTIVFSTTLAIKLDISQSVPMHLSLLNVVILWACFSNLSTLFLSSRY